MAAPLTVRVVLVTTFTNEFSGWIPAVPLRDSLEFPAGLAPGQPPLRVNRTLGVVGVMTGMGPFRTASTLMALGNDARFDLRAAYVLVAGIAGVDPQYGSIGSVFLPSTLIGLGQDYYLDGIGHIANGREDTDTSPPYPTADVARRRQHLHILDAQLVSWAYSLAASVVLPDDDAYRVARANYSEPAAQQPPRVVGGACASVTGETFWAGRQSTEWARNWTRYWSAGQATLAVTDEEDLALAEALSALGRAGLANASRLVVMRSASDYAYEPHGAELRQWFFGPTHMVDGAFAALVTAGLPIVRALTDEPLSASSLPPPPRAGCAAEASSAATAWILLACAIGALIALVVACRVRAFRGGGEAPRLQELKLDVEQQRTAI